MNQIEKAGADTAPNNAGAIALFRQATDVAHVCKEIVMKTVATIADRRYVMVEGWMSIAVAHGCIATIKLVEELPTGYRCVAQLRRQSDQAVLSEAEGFVGRDEPDWFGGPVTRWNKFKKKEETKVMEKRADHAIRAMAQTRAISRVLRNGFAHVVVLMDEGLATVPFEEVSTNGERDEPTTREESAQPAPAEPKAEPKETAKEAEPKKSPEVPRDETIALREQFRGGKWESVEIHFGAKKGTKLGELETKNLSWWITEWAPKPFGNRPIPEIDKLLRAALDVANEETDPK